MKQIFYFLLVVGFSSCYYDNEEELYPRDPSACQTEAVTYSVEVNKIMERKCATPGCHVPGGTGNGFFDKYGGTKAKVDKTMPPNGALSPCEIDKLKSWLAAGAPNN